MAMCKCRDTGAKRCKREYSSPDPFRRQPSPVKERRRRQRQALKKRWQSR